MKRRFETPGKSMLRFNKGYFLITVLLFLLEVFIAFYVNDRIIRPYGGDFLVVIFLYCFIQSFLDIPVFSLALGILAFAFLVEWSQYFHLIDRLGLQDVLLARLILGNSFEWIDLLAYTLGVLMIIFIEELKQGRGRDD